MNLAAKLAAGDVKVIDVAYQAHALRQNLYLTDASELVISPLQKPGWALVAVKIKSPTEATLEPQPWAA